MLLFVALNVPNIWVKPFFIGDERKPKFYVDFSNKQIDQKGYDASEELREKRIPENLEPGNTFSYEVDWSALVGAKYEFKLLSFIEYLEILILYILKSL